MIPLHRDPYFVFRLVLLCYFAGGRPL